MNCLRWHCAQWLMTGLILSLSAAAAHGQTLAEKAGAKACQFAYVPSAKTLYARADFARRVVRLPELVRLGESFKKVKVSLVKDGKILAETTAPMRSGRLEEVAIRDADLEGAGEVRFEFLGGEKPLTVSRPVERQRFKWEGNRLGLDDNEVYPPFKPVVADGSNVHVVLRKLEMNGFGLWNQVIADGKPLLAVPMRLRYQVNGKEGAWERSDVKLVESKPQAAVYAAESWAPAVKAQVRSTIEVDGCMKVELTLLPGERPQTLDRLWVDIPLHEAEAPLMHTKADSIRINYSGRVPAGAGVVWESGQAARAAKWRNTFASYIWLGTPERGMCWFGENDRGWLTEKNESKRPVQEIVREGKTVTLRVLLVNLPAQVKEPRQIVFGVQAAPTKPLPTDWRAAARHMPAHGGPVFPWGGLTCGYQGPYKDDWRPVDKVVESQLGGGEDYKAWFEQWAKENNPPPVCGTRSWVELMNIFAGRKIRPNLVYHEANMAAHIRAEWLTYQDEWGLEEYTPRQWPDESFLRRGYDFDPCSMIAYEPSYRDYGSWYANEWLKRGIGLYWDNDFPHLSVNRRNSAAYVAEDGQVQPALIYWDFRAYHQRIWNLVQQWQRKLGVRLEWSNHMTNGLLLPIHSWGTVNLDFELGADKPFDPDFILAEALPWQTGCHAYALHNLLGRANPIILGWEKQKDELRLKRSRWGSLMVFENTRCGGYGGDSQKLFALPDGTNPEKTVYDFGYDKPEVRIHHFWDTKPALAGMNPKVLWLVLSRPADRNALVVLQSWSDQSADAAVRLSAEALGFAPGSKFTDALTGAAIEGNVRLDEPYMTRLIHVQP